MLAGGGTQRRRRNRPASQPPETPRGRRFFTCLPHRATSCERGLAPLRTHSPNHRVVEQGAWIIRRLRRKAKVELTPWQASGDPPPAPPPEPDGTAPLTPPRGDAVALARFYQGLLDSGKFANRAALARHLGVSRARVTQVLRRLLPGQRPAKAKTAQSPHDEGKAGEVGHE